MRHRGIRQALAEGRLDIEPQFASGLFRALQRRSVGDAHAVMEPCLDATQRQLFFHLGT